MRLNVVISACAIALVGVSSVAAALPGPLDPSDLLRYTCLPVVNDGLDPSCSEGPCLHVPDTIARLEHWGPCGPV